MRPANGNRAMSYQELVIDFGAIRVQGRANNFSAVEWDLVALDFRLNSSVRSKVRTGESFSDGE